MNKTRCSMLAAAVVSCGALAAFSVSTQAAPTALTQVAFKAAAKVKSAQKVKASCPKPRGMRLGVRYYFEITNSDDGVGDRDVEMYGAVRVNGRQIWSIAKNNAVRGYAKGVLNVTTVVYDVIYADSKTWNLVITGYLNDYDKASKDDAMWYTFSVIPQIVNIKQAYEQAEASGQGLAYVTLPGDNDSESAQLVLLINRPGMIY